MPIITVNIGQRNPDAFRRAVNDLKANGFLYDSRKKLWYRFVESMHVQRLVQTLLVAGLRGVVEQNAMKPRKEETQ